MAIHKQFIIRLLSGTMLVAVMLDKGYCQTDEQKLAREILADRELETVYEKGLEILGTGFNAGTGSGQVTHTHTLDRAFNVFIDVMCGWLYCVECFWYFPGTV